MKLEIIMLSEISQTQKDKYLMTSIICGTWKSSSHKIESRMVDQRPGRVRRDIKRN
jgi:hypothetical protein